MVRAYILVRVSLGKAKAVLADVKKVGGVRKAYFVFGRYDIVALAEAKELKGLSEISGRVNTVKGVKSTETLVEG